MSDSETGEESGARVEQLTDDGQKRSYCPNCGGKTSKDGQGRVEVKGVPMYLMRCTECSHKFASELVSHV
jgi:predicted nucleic acid-binding Zn ribbon protein